MKPEDTSRLPVDRWNLLLDTSRNAVLKKAKRLKKEHGITLTQAKDRIARELIRNNALDDVGTKYGFKMKNWKDFEAYMNSLIRSDIEKFEIASNFIKEKGFAFVPEVDGYPGKEVHSALYGIALSIVTKTTPNGKFFVIPSTPIFGKIPLETSYSLNDELRPACTLSLANLSKNAAEFSCDLLNSINKVGYKPINNRLKLATGFFQKGKNVDIKFEELRTNNRYELPRYKVVPEILYELFLDYEKPHLYYNTDKEDYTQNNDYSGLDRLLLSMGEGFFYPQDERITELERQYEAGLLGSL